MMEGLAVNWLSSTLGLTRRRRCVIVSRMKVLVVEDDAALQATLQRTLARRGFVVATAGDGVAALQRWAATPPDAVVLDLSLPGLDGLQVLAQARAQGLVAPVLILTARGTVGDRVLGLNAGADDYLAKPFDLDELEARLRALVRRSGTATGAADVRFGRLRHDRTDGAVYLDDAPLELPPRELALLCALLARPGQAVIKERLFEQVFPGEAEVRYEAIEVVAYRLRRKLAGTGVELVTLRGLGYLLRAEA